MELTVTLEKGTQKTLESLLLRWETSVERLEEVVKIQSTVVELEKESSAPPADPLKDKPKPKPKAKGKKKKKEEEEALKALAKKAMDELRKVFQKIGKPKTKELLSSNFNGAGCVSDLTGKDDAETEKNLQDLIALCAKELGTQAPQEDAGGEDMFK